LAEATHLLGLPRKHKPKEIQPQGEGSGLDADKVDGLHASEIGGGGPHASSHETGGGDLVHFADLEHDEGDLTLHDALTTTPHISQAEKDKIHDRLHTLSSALDHSGIITDAQHGDKTTIPNAHHAQLHQASHQSGGSDALPWGSGGGLDADKLDGKHLSEIGHQALTAIGTTNVSTSSTEFVDMPGMSITITTGNNPVLILFSFSGFVDGYWGDFQLLLDGSVLSKAKHGEDYSPRSIGVSVTFMRLQTLSAGSHTIKVQWRVSNAGRTLYNNVSAGNWFHRELTVIELKA